MITQSTTQDFIKAVGAPNANYLLGPVSWHEKMAGGSFCPYFSSAIEFKTKFREMFDVDPTYHSAAAAAGGIALMAAVARLGAAALDGWGRRLGTPDAEIRKMLLQLDIDTFYGKLKFADNGILLNKSSVAQQVQPLAESHSREDRYTKSALDYVGTEAGAGQLLYEMPTWEQKELEVFPCDPGYVINQSDVQSTSCEPCAIGRFRPSSSLAYGDCGVSFYSDEE